MIDAMAAEWAKVRTVRSTYWTLAVAAVFLVLVTLLAVEMAQVWDGLDARRRSEYELRPLQELASWAAALCLGVFGVLSVTSEYRTGMIRTTLAVLPRRGTLVAAKAVVVGAVALVAGEVSVGAFVGTRLVIGDRPFPDQHGSIAHGLPDFLMVGTSVALFALLGLALGLLLRSTAGAIVTVVLLWHVVPLLVFQLPGPWNERIGSVLPGGLPRRVAGFSGEGSVYGDLLSPVSAALLLLGYVVVPVGLAALAVKRRDA